MEELDYKGPLPAELIASASTLTSSTKPDSKPYTLAVSDQPQSPSGPSGKTRIPTTIPIEELPAYYKSDTHRPTTRNDGYIPLATEWAHLLHSKSAPATFEQVYLYPSSTPTDMSSAHYHNQPQDNWRSPIEAAESYQLSEVSQEYILNKERQRALREVDNAECS